LIKRRRKVREILVHPVWVKQSWWPLLAATSVKRIKLGNFVSAFSPENVTGREPPDWEFAATIVKPN
jgi:hypothetical protein